MKIRITKDGRVYASPRDPRLSGQRAGIVAAIPGLQSELDPSDWARLVRVAQRSRLPQALVNKMLADAARLGEPAEGAMADVAAVQLFADEHGPDWALLLNRIWANGRDDHQDYWHRYHQGALRRLRNRGGLDVLYDRED